MSDDISIAFPCPYPIKVIGETDDRSVAAVLEIVRRHAPEVTPDQVNTRQSRTGKFHSVRIEIIATGEAQLLALHTELMTLDSVRMVL